MAVSPTSICFQLVLKPFISDENLLMLSETEFEPAVVVNENGIETTGPKLCGWKSENE